MSNNVLQQCAGIPVDATWSVPGPTPVPAKRATLDMAVT